MVLEGFVMLSNWPYIPGQECDLVQVKASVRSQLAVINLKPNDKFATVYASPWAF